MYACKQTGVLLRNHRYIIHLGRYAGTAAPPVIAISVDASSQHLQMSVQCSTVLSPWKIPGYSRFLPRPFKYVILTLYSWILRGNVMDIYNQTTFTPRSAKCRVRCEAPYLGPRV